MCVTRYSARGASGRTICILCNGDSDIVDDPGPDSDPWVGAPGQGLFGGVRIVSLKPRRPQG